MGHPFWMRNYPPSKDDTIAACSVKVRHQSFVNPKFACQFPSPAPCLNPSVHPTCHDGPPVLDAPPLSAVEGRHYCRAFCEGASTVEELLIHQFCGLPMCLLLCRHTVLLSVGTLQLRGQRCFNYLHVAFLCHAALRRPIGCSLFREGAVVATSK